MATNAVAESSSTSAPSTSEAMRLTCQRFGLGLSWDHGSGGIDLDIQAVAFDKTGRLMNAVYYNNLKAFGKGLTHSSDETTGLKAGMDEVVWADFSRLPDDVALIVYVIACYTGGCHLHDVQNGKFHALEDKLENEVLLFELEKSDEEVDLVAAIQRIEGTWYFKQVHVPAQDGQHFMDILEPTIGNFVRTCIPAAPRRIKAAFAMEKGSLVDLPRTAEIKQVSAALGWDTEKGEVDLDVSAILLDEKGSHMETIFFGNLEAHGVKHSGDNLTGAGSGDDEVIEANLEAMSARVQQIFFVINIYTAGKSFALVANPYCRVITLDGEELCKFCLADAGDKSGLIMARLLKEPGGQRWGFQALGMPSKGTMWKDCMPDVVKYAGVQPHALQTLPTNSSLSEVVTGTVVSVDARPSESTRPAFAPPPRSSTGDSVKVTIVSACGLRAADWTGKSDPYCICDIPGTSSKVQTATKMMTLNPKWNETFMLNGCPPAGQILRFTLMDYDFGRSHDLLGEASLSAEQLVDSKFEGDLDVFYSKTGGAAAKLKGTLKVQVQRC